MLLQATLFMDLNATTPNSNPGQFTNVNGTVFFTTPFELGGETLWFSGGTEESTVSLGVIGAQEASTSLTRFQDQLYFVSYGTSARQLKRSDGTAPGTVPLTSFTYNGTIIRNLTPSTTGLFLTIDHDSVGEELWLHTEIDGHPITEMVFDPFPGSNSFPANLVDVNGAVFFTALDSSGLRRLYRSDGTPQGSGPVLDATGLASASLSAMGSVGGRLYYGRPAQASGVELWITDGTPVGTYLVKDIRPGSASSTPTGITDVDGDAFFFADDGVNGIELWRSDGTASGTDLVKDIRPGVAGSTPANPVSAGGRLFFTANDGINGTELWVSDGTDGGTRLVTDINPAGSSSPASLTVVSDRVFFTADDGVHGRELWVSDGTAEGTYMVDDLYPGSRGAEPSGLSPGDGGVWFSARDPLLGVEPFFSTGEPGGTRMLKDIDDRIMSSSASSFVVTTTGARYFDALLRLDNTSSTLNYVNGLLTTDGTVEGTRVVSEGVSANRLTAIDDRVFFFHGGLWVSDGTEQGTVKISTVNHQQGTTQPYGAAAVNGKLLFSGRPNLGSGFFQLWVSDGTPEGTHLLKAIGNSSTQGGRPGWFTVMDDVLYFFAIAPGLGFELWRSDGTADGTYLVKDINPGPASTTSSAGTIMRAHDGTLYFFADDGIHGQELWTSDGTAEGTMMVRDIIPGPDGSFVTPQNQLNHMLGVADHVFFTALDGPGLTALWKTDGTEMGTVKLLGELSHAPYPFQEFHGKLLFVTPRATSTGALRDVVWISDGTPEGTQLIRGFSGSGSTSLRWVGVLGDWAFFAVEDGVHGRELWRTDGSLDGTLLVRDINPGSPNSTPVGKGQIGPRLFISATESSIGNELWTVTAPDTAPPQILSARFAYNTAPHAVNIRFSEDVFASLAADDLIVQNLTTGQTVPPSAVSLQYDFDTHTARFAFIGLQGGVLPDGSYRASIASASVTDAVGQNLASEFSFDFTFIRGDANGDGAVNLADFNILAANFGRTERVFSQGDFNYDGVVNLADFNILASRFGAVLGPALAGRGSLFSDARTPSGDRDDNADLLSDQA